MPMNPLVFHDCHIFSLPSQGGVYTLCRLPTTGPNSRIRLLAASLRRPLYLLEFNQGFKQSLVPYARDLSFTYISGQVEIVSITAFSKPGTSSTVIGVTYIKTGNADVGQFLNIYTIKDIGPELSADSLAFSSSVEISYVPYHLTHCGYADNEVVLVVSGSDCKIHLYHEDSTNHIAQEKEMEEFFPEFKQEFPSVVLWISFYIILGESRLTAVGCECGAVYLYIINLKSNTITSTHQMDHGSSVTSLKFFRMQNMLHLLVTNALLPASVYKNILERGLSECTSLAGSELHDVVTCSSVCDLHMDQHPTILLGTYGQELLVYRCLNDSWVLSWQKSFSHPILSVDYCDVTGDGVKELIVLTTRGVQVLQHDLDYIAELLLDRVGNQTRLNCVE